MAGLGLSLLSCLLPALLVAVVAGAPLTLLPLRTAEPDLEPRLKVTKIEANKVKQRCLFS